MMTKMIHNALANPPISWLRKTSTKTRKSKKIHAIHTKKINMLQKKPSIG